ncbi:MAG TPA: hypothetical protein VLA12_07155 [Planctomycetaceae bacterium]|nr:hypothetical protein [Planctomycetaceae bacterium]
MQAAFVCPSCEQQTRLEIQPTDTVIRCAHCDWSRPIAADAFVDGIPQSCLACGCQDLWKQRDFSPKLGVAIVATAAVLSTIAFAYYMPVWAIGILMCFGALDYFLYAIMPDVLVCYRCAARFREASLPESVPHFDLEIAERYRQESIRLKDSEKSTS